MTGYKAACWHGATNLQKPSQHESLNGQTHGSAANMTY